jgi:hypothetical protein
MYTDEVRCRKNIWHYIPHILFNVVYEDIDTNYIGYDSKES